MSRTKKNGRIELLRFLFAIMILLFHIQKRFLKQELPIGNTSLTFFNHGCIGVEFFFLVSGYLLASHFFKMQGKPCESIGTETASYVWKKIKNIFPYHFYAVILTIIANSYFLRDTAAERIEFWLESWGSVFFIQIFGFKSTWVNKLTWYLDVWLVVTFIFYIFGRKHYDVFVKIVCPILALFILGYLDHEYGQLAGTKEWTGHFYRVFLRGTAEMALGCSAYSLTRRLNQEKFARSGRITLMVLEVVGYLLALVYACTPCSGRYAFPVLFILWGSMILTFSDVNPGGEFFEKPVFDWMGKMSLLIYLNQFYCIRLVQELLPDLSFAGKLFACVILTFLASMLSGYLVDCYLRHRPIHRLLYGDTKN